MTYVVSKEFSDAPGGRFRTDGPLSGEEFRETILKELLQTHSGTKILVDLDGGFGYAPSFLEEAFGGLARQIGADEVRTSFDFKSDDEPDLLAKIQEYISNANA